MAHVGLGHAGAAQGRHHPGLGQRLEAGAPLGIVGGVGAVDDHREPVRAFALENHRSERECDKALADRIEAIFRIAAANGTETLIVGAFGCGRNGYPVEQVIELIQNWIAEHPGAVPNVVFAVPRMHADAFREAFGAPEPERPAPVVVAEGENDREGDDEDWRNVELPEGVTLR